MTKLFGLLCMLILLSGCSQIKSYKDRDLWRCTYGKGKEIVGKPYAKYDNQVYFEGLDTPVLFNNCGYAETID